VVGRTKHDDSTPAPPSGARSMTTSLRESATPPSALASEPGPGARVTPGPAGCLTMLDGMANLPSRDDAWGQL
jgi:hypothetical protein